MPHPDTLDRYNQIVPGAAERIIRMAEEDAAHLREIERQEQQAYTGNFRRGQWFGASVCVLAFVLAGYVAWLGHPAAAAVIGGGTPLAQLASAFLSQQPWRRRRAIRGQSGNAGPPDGVPVKDQES